MVNSLQHGNLTHAQSQQHSFSTEFRNGRVVGKGGNAFHFNFRHAQNNNQSKDKELNAIPIPSDQYWGKLFKRHITEQSSLRSEA